MFRIRDLFTMKNGLIDVEKKGFFIFVFGVLREANFMFFNGLIVGGLNFHHGFLCI